MPGNGSPQQINLSISLNQGRQQAIEWVFITLSLVLLLLFCLFPVEHLTQFLVATSAFLSPLKSWLLYQDIAVSSNFVRTGFEFTSSVGQPKTVAVVRIHLQTQSTSIHDSKTRRGKLQIIARLMKIVAIFHQLAIDLFFRQPSQHSLNTRFIVIGLFFSGSHYLLFEIEFRIFLQDFLSLKSNEGFD